jgi:hypothetical protein
MAWRDAILVEAHVLVSCHPQAVRRIARDSVLVAARLCSNALRHINRESTHGRSVRRGAIVGAFLRHREVMRPDFGHVVRCPTNVTWLSPTAGFRL